MTDTGHDAFGAATSKLNAAVTGIDRRTLDAICRHPLAHNPGGRSSTYATLPDQYDAFVWFDETHAVTPLPTTVTAGEDETYPFGL